MTEEQKKDDRQHLILELEYKNGEKVFNASIC